MLNAKILASTSDNRPVFVASSQTSNGSTGSSLVINTPPGALDGDLLISAVGTDGNASTWTASGWTLIDFESTNGPALYVSYRFISGTPPASYTFTNGSSSQTLGGMILCYRYATFDTNSEFARVTSGAGVPPLTLPSVTASAAGELINLMFTVADGNTLSISPTDETIVYHDTSSPNFIVTRTVVEAGATGTREFNGFNMSTGGKDGASLAVIGD